MFFAQVSRSVHLAHVTPCAICAWRETCFQVINGRLQCLARPLARSASFGPGKPRDRFNFNDTVVFDTNSDVDHTRLPKTRAVDIRSSSSPPLGVKMLARDFIDDALYNPQYGYFAKQAVILSTAEPFNFPSMKNSAAFDKALSEQYAGHDALYDVDKILARQVWHTPTELFKPWYGRAIAHCLTSDYMLKYFPYEDFIIYEIGAGNGTLARNILDFLKNDYPEVYDRTSYRIIEISPALAKLQSEQLAGSHPCVEIVNKSVFDWETPVLSPCYFLAMEVIDNFPHDVVRYRTDDLQPAQCLVVIDEEGNFSELYEPISDPVIARFLSYRNALKLQPPAFKRWRSSSLLRSMRRYLPFAPNLSPPEYIPTTTLLFLELLRRYFPSHRLLLSDFSSLPDAIPGYNAPVVQTRYKGSMIPCTTYLVKSGHFDIFFPTSFDFLSQLYEYVLTRPAQVPSSYERSSPLGTTASSIRMGNDFFSSRDRMVQDTSTSGPSLLGHQICSVFTHKEFMSRYANLEATTLRNGENPLLDLYQNVKFLF